MYRSIVRRSDDWMRIYLTDATHQTVSGRVVIDIRCTAREQAIFNEAATIKQRVDSVPRDRATGKRILADVENLLARVLR
jgi:hypothetical protein